MTATTTETAILAGGCFWGMQELIRHLPGVIATRVGYSGGDVSHATYRRHGTHAEAIEVVFDPARLSYRELLAFFFQIHDPTTPDRQGNDRGTSYRSVICTLDDVQARIARETVAEVDASGRWPGRIVTQIQPAGPFWEAEPEHQDYLQRHPDGYTCHFVRPHWRLTRPGEPEPPRLIDWAEVLRRGRGANVAPPRRVEQPESAWRARLTPEQFHVTRRKGTERPFSSAMCGLFEPGRYHCACCDTPLFDAAVKFDSGTGWPSFTQPVDGAVVAYHLDRSYGMERVETTCAVCDAHLGHVFPDGPPPSGLRYCINALALKKAGD
ncbi:MAG: peptide-methionine (R)-S-oxide reductase [Pseudomonadota bacterium]|jgi:peptide-methionine (S)-S-oxide reductase